MTSYFESEDYSQYAFPVLKALEGHIKILLNAANISYNSKNIGGVFHFNQTNDSYYLDNTSIDEPLKINIEKCYNHYCLTRHKVFHFGDIIGNTDNTFLFDSKEQVNEVIIETLKLINGTVY